MTCRTWSFSVTRERNLDPGPYSGSAVLHGRKSAAPSVFPPSLAFFVIKKSKPECKDIFQQKNNSVVQSVEHLLDFYSFQSITLKMLQHARQDRKMEVRWSGAVMLRLKCGWFRENTHNTTPWGIGTWPLAIPHLGCGLSERKIVDRDASKEISVTVGVILKRKPRLDLLKDFCTSWLEPLVQLVIVNDVKLLHLIPCFVSSSWNNTKSVAQNCTVHYMQIVFEYLSSQAAWSLVWEYVFVERTMWDEGAGGQGAVGPG